MAIQLASKNVLKPIEAIECKHVRTQAQTHARIRKHAYTHAHTHEHTQTYTHI